MAHIVTCIYCKHKFDRDKYPFITVSNRRYAHQECGMSEDQKKSKEIQDKEELDEYIKQLFKISYVDARIQKQIKQYVEEYQYGKTYSVTSPVIPGYTADLLFLRSAHRRLPGKFCAL